MAQPPGRVRRGSTPPGGQARPRAAGWDVSRGRVPHDIHGTGRPVALALGFHVHKLILGGFKRKNRN